MSELDDLMTIASWKDIIESVTKLPVERWYRLNEGETWEEAKVRVRKEEDVKRAAATQSARRKYWANRPTR
jgi:hypothetical protein